MIRLYLAGPDVFTRDPIGVGARKRAICARHGFDGVYPMDNIVIDPALAPTEQGLAIYDANEATMRSCDGAIVNLTPYHGPSMDVGSAFELGFMRALGRPVFGYTNEPRGFAERVVIFAGGATARRRDGLRETPDGMAIEEFDMHDNLMVDGSIMRSTGILTTVASDGSDEAIIALESFELCVREAARWFAAYGDDAGRVSRRADAGR